MASRAGRRREADQDTEDSGRTPARREDVEQEMDRRGRRPVLGHGGDEARKAERKRSRAAAFAAARPKGGAKVLRDTEFSRELTRIIRRDFFPDAPPIDSDDEREQIAGKDLPRLGDFLSTHTSRRNAAFARLQDRDARDKRKRARTQGVNPSESPRFPLLGDRRRAAAAATHDPRLAEASRHRRIVAANTRLGAQDQDHDFDDSISEFSGRTEQTAPPSHARRRPNYYGYAYLDDNPSYVDSRGRDHIAALGDGFQATSSSSTSSHNPFAVPAPPKRDELARDLARQMAPVVPSAPKAARTAKSEKGAGRKLSSAGMDLAKRLLGQ